MKWVLIIVGIVVLLAAAAGFGLYKLYTFGAEELQPLAHQALTDLDAGKYDEVYQGAAQAFRDSASLDELRAIIERRKRVLGAYREIERVQGTNISTSNETGTVATLTTRLVYEKGETDGTFHFVKEGEVWKLSGFDLEGLEKTPDEAAPGNAPAETPAPDGAGG
jgi:hypothetical protein